MKINDVLALGLAVALIGCSGSISITPSGGWITTVPDDAAPGDIRLKIPLSELSDPGFMPRGQIHNGWFLPVGEHGAATHALNGTLQVASQTMRRSHGGEAGQDVFPGFEVDLFSEGGFLVPVTRHIQAVQGDSYWTLLFAPGQVWSEPTDNGYARAAFPFVLCNPFNNAAHHGVATFAYNQRQVTKLRFQITQETAPGDIFDAWGQLELSYQPRDHETYSAARGTFLQERADRFPVRPLTDLGMAPNQLSALTAGIHPQQISLIGIVKDGVLFQGTAETRFGPFPFPETMQVGAYSVSKSVAGLTLMFLAQQYDADLPNERIVDWLPLEAAHDGWDQAKVPGADGLWSLLQRDLFEPIGIHHLPMQHTLEDQGAVGIPLLSHGAYVTGDDLAKISVLLQNGGSHNGRQLVHPAMVRQALFREDPRGYESGVLDGDAPQYYRHGFWSAVHAADGACRPYAAVMRSLAGNTVLLAPNGLTAFRFSDSNNQAWDGMQQVLDDLAPYPCNSF